MAAPNLGNLTTISGGIVGQSISTTITAILANGSTSSTVYKVNALYVSNIGATAASVTVNILTGSAQTFYIAYQISVPAQSTLDVINKSIYLIEGHSLQLTGSASAALSAVCSYELMS